MVCLTVRISCWCFVSVAQMLPLLVPHLDPMVLWAQTKVVWAIKLLGRDVVLGCSSVRGNIRKENPGKKGTFGGERKAQVLWAVPDWFLRETLNTGNHCNAVCLFVIAGPSLSIFIASLLLIFARGTSVGCCYWLQKYAGHFHPLYQLGPQAILMSGPCRLLKLNFSTRFDCTARSDIVIGVHRLDVTCLLYQFIDLLPCVTVLACDL